MRIMLTLSATLIGAWVAGVAAATASADPVDDQFLDSLNAAGITYPDAGKVVVVGKYVCTMVDQGKQLIDVVKTIQAQNPGLHGDNAAKFTAIAANVYCPGTLGH